MRWGAAGEILRGDRIANTLYDVRTNVNESCLYVCGQEPGKMTRK